MEQYFSNLCCLILVMFLNSFGLYAKFFLFKGFICLPSLFAFYNMKCLQFKISKLIECKFWHQKPSQDQKKPILCRGLIKNPSPGKIASFFSPSFVLKIPHFSKKFPWHLSLLVWRTFKIKKNAVNCYFFIIWRVCWFYYKIIYLITLLNI